MQFHDSAPRWQRCELPGPGWIQSFAHGGTSSRCKSASSPESLRCRAQAPVVLTAIRSICVSYKRTQLRTFCCNLVLVCRKTGFALCLSIFTFSDGTGDDAPKSYTETNMVLTPAQKSQLTRYDRRRRFANAAARFRSMRSRCAGDSAGASTASINPALPIPYVNADSASLHDFSTRPVRLPFT